MLTRPLKEKRKVELIISANPEWRFLNTDILEEWPPKVGEATMRGNLAE